MQPGSVETGSAETVETDALTETMDLILIEECPELQDPELGGMHLAEIKYMLNEEYGFLYEKNGETVEITLRFTSPMCPVGVELGEASAHFIFGREDEITNRLQENGFDVERFELEVVDFVQEDEVNELIQEIKEEETSE